MRGFRRRFLTDLSRYLRFTLRIGLGGFIMVGICLGVRRSEVSFYRLMESIG